MKKVILGHFYVQNSIFYQKCQFLKKNHAENHTLQTFSLKCFCRIIEALKMNNSALVLIKYSNSFENNLKNSESIIFNPFLLLPWQPLHAWVILW